MSNPLLSPAYTPDFSAIKTEHFLPAVEAALAQDAEDAARLKAMNEAPTFENTILPLSLLHVQAGYISNLLGNLELNGYEKKKSGINLSLSRIFSRVARITRVERIVKALNDRKKSAHNKEISRLNEAVRLRIEATSKDLYQDPVFAQRVKAVYDARASLNLDADDLALLEDTYGAFEGSGGYLKDDAAKAELRRLDEKLISLAQQFNNNMKESPKQNAVLITDKAELAGLTDENIDTLKQQAVEAGHAEGWLFIPERLLVDEWLGKAENSTFRRKMYESLCRLGTVAPHDNRPVILEMQKNRHAYAQILGYASYAAMAREDAMITDLTKVKTLLDDLTAKALPKFEADMQALEKFAADNGGPAKLEPWDTPYWINRQRTAVCNFDAVAFSEYLPLDKVTAGMFDQASRMFGVSFTKVGDQQTMHPDIEVYAVTDSDSKDLVGYLHVDMYARSGTKSGGAWMSCLQSQTDGHPVVITFNMNLERPAAGKQTLVDLEQYVTCYHELGHCLQGLLGMNVKHLSQQGTSGPADFVEIHSMINERRALLPDNLKAFALHHETGQPPSDQLIADLRDSRSFFATWGILRLVQNSYRDLAFHSLDPALGHDAETIEAMVRINSPYADHLRAYGLPRFDHLFAEGKGGYAAAYDHYLLAEIHAAHGFMLFENDPYNPQLLARIKAFYQRGSGGVHLDVFRTFRGEDATPDAMLKEMGIAPKAASSTSTTAKPAP